MKRCLVFRYQKAQSPEDFSIKVLRKLLTKEFPGTEFVWLENQKAFELKLKTADHDAAILDWGTCPSPAMALEGYFQSAYCKTPLIIMFQRLKKIERALLKEYSAICIAEVLDPKRDTSYGRTLALLREMKQPTVEQIRKRFFQVRIHYWLNNHDSTKALVQFEKIKSALTEQDLVFYNALFLKAENKLKDAAKVISDAPTANSRNTGLLGTIFFRAQNYEKALKYFQIAHSVSPLHLRRGFLIFRCLEELSAQNPAYKVDAMAQLLAIHKTCPNYPRVNGKIIELVVNDQNLEKIPIISPLLLQASQKELMALYKKLKNFENPFKSAFIDVLVNAMSKQANAMIQVDDLTALKYYKYIGKLLPANDEKRRLALDYCLARAYFRFGQLEMAQEINSRVVTQNPGYEKAAALKILIEKALNGDFDVLLDDEKDWLIKKEAS
jgi:tetratricopeptide (TPR) repeat protein